MDDLKDNIENIREANHDTACRIWSLEVELEETENYEDNIEHNFTLEKKPLIV